MTKVSNKKFLCKSLRAGSAVYLFTAGLAYSSLSQAQSEPATAPQAEATKGRTKEGAAPQEVKLEEVVVTGTQIRGIEPVGANAVGLDQTQIQLTGANDINQVLAQIPQSNFFLDNPEPGGTGPLASAANGAPRVPVSRANLRNIPGTGSGSGSPTLVLIDGHRVVPMGIEQSVVDPGVIPVGILERVEVLLDGSSAIYGSDAVGGVINFITRKRFAGTEITAHGGYADSYSSADASLTHGITWDTGGISLNYEFAKNSNILNNERSHELPLNWIGQTGGNFIGFTAPMVDDLTCDTSNIQNATAGASQSVIYSGASRVRGASFCAGNGYETYVPSQERNSGFLVFNQELSNSIQLDVTAFYTDRKQVSNTGAFMSTVTVQPTNANYLCITEFGCTAPQRVSFSYGPVLGHDSFYTETVTQVGQITPELTFNFGKDWQARTTFVWGKSDTSVDQDKLDTTRQNSLVAAGSINPYNIGSSNRATIDSLVYHFHNDAIQEFSQARVVADGPWLKLPAGDLRVAVGGEWMKTEVRRRITDATTLLLQPYRSASVDNLSAFAEFAVPLVSPDMAIPLVNRLSLSLSGRYDDYGDAGTPFNPKIATAYNPVDWITIRANWGKSFRAPNAIDELLVNSSQVRCIGAVGGCTGAFGQPPAAVAPPFPASPNNIYLFLTGTQPDLKPETSTSWSAGIDLLPPFIPGLKFSGSYWRIDFVDFISSPITTSVAQLFDNPALYTLSPTPAQQLAFVQQANGGEALLSFVNGAGYTVRYLADSRVRNLGGAIISGVDLSVQYRHAVGFGDVFGSVNATIPERNDFRINPLGAYTDVTKYDTPSYTLTANLGAQVGNFLTQATVRYRPGFTANPITPRLSPDVGSFAVIDLAFRYAFEGSGLFTKDVEATFNANNILDTAPPLNYTTAGGTYAGISNIGRFMQLGLSKKF